MSRKKEERVDKVRVSRPELDAALKKIRPVVKGAGQLSALRNCRLTVVSRPDGQRLTIEATNLRESLVLEVSAEDGKEGPLAVVDFERLAGFMASDWSEDVELWVEGGRLVCKGKTMSKIVVVSGEDDYPVLPVAPEEGEWWGSGRGLIEELLIAKRFSLGGDNGPAESFLILVEEDGELRILAGAGSVGWLREMKELAAPAGWRIELTHEAVVLLASVFEGEHEILRTEHHDFFRAPGVLLSQRRPEGAGWNPLTVLRGKAFSGGEDAALPALINLIPILEGVVSAGEDDSKGKTRRFPLVIKETASSAHRSVTIYSDLVSGEGEIEAPFPEFKTGRPDHLIAALKALDKLAGAGGVVTVADVGGDSRVLRLSVKGKASAWLTAIKA